MGGNKPFRYFISSIILLLILTSFGVPLSPALAQSSPDPVIESFATKKKVTPAAVSATPTPTPSISPTITASLINTGFEDGSSGFLGRSSNESITTTGSYAKTGSYSLKVSNRSAMWHGAEIDLTKVLQAGHTYQVSAWVYYNTGSSTLRIDCKINKNQGQNYLSFGSVNATKGTWTKLTGSITVPEDTTSARFYFEAASATDDFYLDDVLLNEAVVTPVEYGETESLAEAYKDYFDIGAATPDGVLKNEAKKTLVLSQFSTITVENELKPYSLLDYNSCSLDPTKYNTSPAINLSRIDKYLSFAKENGLKMRFHTLVWHNQTPRWFFTRDYSMSPSAPLASKETMLARMESYIKQVMQRASNYPDVVYAWDVVNEAIEPSHNQANGYRTRDSLWYQIIGAEFVEKAFTYARKYSYDDAGLFYNDYGEYDVTKRTAIYNLLKKLKEKDLIDGLGMQSHIDMNYPSIANYEAALKVYGELGLEIHVTELDMHNNQDSQAAFEKQAARYQAIFEVLLKAKKKKIANITSVTFWGVLDSDSWLTSFKGETSYPLLFDRNGKPKAAFYSILALVDK